MKVKLDIDCTPEEARRFMGLPDVTELHQAWMQKMQETMQQGAAEDLFNIWSQMGQAGMQQWQAFLSTADDAAPKSKKSK